MVKLLTTTDDRDMRELALERLVDLNRAAQAIEGHSAVLAQLAAGLSPDGVLHAQTRSLDASTGTRLVQSRVPAHSIAVANLGTGVLTVSNAGMTQNPPGESAGMLKLLPGQAACVPLIGSAHALWGRPGDLFTFIAYKTLQPFAMSSVGGTYFAFSLAGIAVGSPVTYTTPWGDPGYYGGLAVRDTAGAAGTSDTSELLIADSAGVILDEVNLAGRESTEDSHTNPTKATTSKIVATLNKGAIAGMLRVW